MTTLQCLLFFLDLTVLTLNFSVLFFPPERKKPFVARFFVCILLLAGVSYFTIVSRTTEWTVIAILMSGVFVPLFLRLQQWQRTLFASLTYLCTVNMIQSFCNFIFSESVFNVTHSVVMLCCELVMTIICILLRSDSRGERLLDHVFTLPAALRCLLVFVFMIQAMLISGISALGTYPNTIGFQRGLLAFGFLSFLLLSVTNTLIVSYALSRNRYRMRADLLTRQLEQQVAFYTEQQRQEKLLQLFRHDFKNHQLCLSALFAEKKYEEAEAYLQQMTTLLPTSANPFHTGNGIADALLKQKKAVCDEKGIAFTFDGTIPAHGMKPIDLCVMLSNAIDNAIEAVDRISETGQRAIHAVTKNTGVSFQLSVSNPTVAPVLIRNNRVRTTKTEKELHGFGIYNIRRAAAHYDGEVSLSCDNGIFSIKIACLIPNETVA